MDLKTSPHDAEDQCAEYHCYSHGIDEPHGERFCGECFHSWATERELRADFEREGGSLEHYPNGVPFCPLCIHDF